MIGQIGKRLATVIGMVLIATTSAMAQPPTRSLIADALPWGLTWQDVDTVITQKVIAADSSMGDAISRPEPGVIVIEGTPFSKFTARDLRLHYHEEAGIVATEWRFTGTRILSAIGVYDYLRPALVIELGKPNAMNDSSIAATDDLRASTRSDRSLMQKLQKEEVPLSSQWKIRDKGRELLVDLRVDNESGETVLSIIDPKRAEKILAEKETDDDTTQEGTDSEQKPVQIADTTSEVEKMTPEESDEVSTPEVEPSGDSTPEPDADNDHEGSNHGKPS